MTTTPVQRPADQDAAAADLSQAAARPGALDPQRVAALLRQVAPTAGERDTAPTLSPLTGDAIGSVPRCTADDVEAAFTRARTAQQGWARRTPHARARVLLRLHDLVLERQAEALDLIQLESGKARKHAFEEIADTAMCARYYGRSAPGLLAPQRRRGAIPLLTKAVELHAPKGVVGIIAPWNYPLSLALTDALAALVAGNAVVIKPDSQTPFTALWAAQLLADAGLPEGLFQVVPGAGSVVGSAIIGRADYVCFTGSTATGRAVAEQAGRRLIGCSLELGGKNAMLVLADADLDKAAEGAVRASYASGGQLCMSIERLYVDEAVREPFTAKFVDRVKAMRLGIGLDWSADMGSLISAGQLATVQQHVDEAVAKGARVLAGGKARPDIGPLVYEPTVLDGVTPEMAVCGEETFGPVVSVYGFRTEDEAVERANATDYGLNASVWSRDTGRARAIGARLQAGTVNVNEGYSAGWGSMDAPMGGFKSSGLSRRHGREGLLKYTEPQTVAVQRLLPIDAPFGMPYQRYAGILTVALRALKRIPGVR